MLFSEAKGNLRTARRLAGYSDKTPITSITNSLKDEIVEECKKYLASAAPSAIHALVEIIQGEMPVPGAKDRIAAAKEILDRAGLVKQDVNQRKTTDDTRIIFMLPPKNEDDRRNQTKEEDHEGEGDFDR